jgi:hypothetical protein
MREDTRADLAGDTPMLHRAAETLTVVTGSQRRPAETSIGGVSMAVVVAITVLADTTAAEDITVPALDSALACTRLTDMPLQSAIPPDSMIQMASGSIIRAALCHTDIKLVSERTGGKHSNPSSTYFPPLTVSSAGELSHHRNLPACQLQTDRPRSACNSPKWRSNRRTPRSDRST